MFVWIFWKESANYFSCQIFIQIYFELSIFIWNDNRLLIFLWLFLIRKNVLKTNTLWATHEQHICTATTYSLKKMKRTLVCIIFSFVLGVLACLWVCSHHVCLFLLLFYFLSLWGNFPFCPIFIFFPSLQFFIAIFFFYFNNKI